ncbi:MAG: hypothetical protein OXG87_02300 [Gemmatimonadetes bacterium]|nr:hypothetical protein [Gemmatimonadota bacterium]
MRDLEKLADEIASKIDRAVNDAERKIKKKWKGNWEARVHSASSDFQTATNSFKRVPDRLADLATDGSCAMRYLFAYGLIGMAILMGFSGLLLVLITLVEHPPWVDGTNPFRHEELSAGLCIIVFSQIIWWAGRRVKRSGDKKAHAKNQHRILRLAREKGGNLTVTEAAMDTRITVEKTEEILRELTISGHVEMRISDSGLVVYHFPEIERWDEKYRARPVDEL